jgi:outer membrane protein OmpA-like peptidoglycan-associated protein/Tol biopolymer transport system component
MPKPLILKKFVTYLLTGFTALLIVLAHPVLAQKSKAKAAAQSSLPDYKAIGAGFSRSDQQLLQLSDKYFGSEQYAEAVKYYAQLSEKHPDNVYIAYQRAECHRKLFQYTQAESAYGKVTYADSVHYPKAVFYYGLMQKMNGNYAYAVHTFDVFAKQAAALNEEQLPQKNQWLERARQEQDGCQSALIREKFVHGNFQFKALSSPVSSPAHDYAPALMGSDSLIAITSGRTDKKNVADARLGEAFSDLYMYDRQTDSVWSVNTEKLPNINSSWSDGAGFLTADGTKFYFTSCQGPGANCAIYVTERKNNRWQKPVRLNENINESNSDSRHPSLTPTGDTLYFVSNRAGGYGLNDIWMSRKTGKEEWNVPVNMGSKINTAYNDISPFYYAADKQFFFASEGHPGQGGLDLYFVNLSENFRDRMARNLGPPFNSNRDDAFLVLGQKQGFLASNREGGIGNFDIYNFLIRSQHSEIAAVDQTKNIAKPDLAYLAAFQFEYLSTEDKLMLDRIASKREAGRLYGTDLPLTEEESHFYEKLSSQEKNRAEGMITTLLHRKDSASLLEEDKYYYEKLAAGEDRHHLQRIAQAYKKAQQDKSAVVLDEEDKQYYESLSQIERNRLYRQVAGQLTHRINGDESTVEQDNYYYEQLSSEEKDRINRMAAARYAAKLNNHEEEIKAEDGFFYEKLSSQEKGQLDRVIAARMRHLGDSLDVSMLTDEDRSFYEKLPPEEKERIKRMAAARYAAALNATKEHFTEEDKFLYEKLSPEEKDRLSRVLTAHNPGERTKMDLSQLSEEDQFQYEKLSPDEKDRINRMAAARYAARMNGTEEQLTEEDKFFYEKLSAEEKAQLDRFVAVRMGMSKDGMDLSTLTEEEQSYYEKLSPIEKERIERMAKARLSATVNGKEPAYAAEDAFFYEKLSPEEKDRLNRLMAARSSGGRELLDKSMLEESDVVVYEQLSSEEKDRINRMAAARYAARMNGTEEKFTEADKFFYEKLSPEEKRQVDRMMAARAATKGMFRDESTVDGDSFSFHRIPSESNRILGTKNPRKLKNHLVTDESVLNGTSADDTLSKLNASWIGKYKEVTLSGKLMDAKTGQPAAGLPLPLVNDKGKIIKTTTTNPDGTFQYLNLSLSENLYIRVETPEASLTETQVLYVEDMELTAYKETSVPAVFEAAYFDFDSYVLKRTTAQVLDKLVDYYKKNPDVQIELNAFTDEKGSDDYNLRLSNRRGLAVQTYLQKKGVLPASLVMYARGELKGNSVTRFGAPQSDAAARKVTISIQKNTSEASSESFVIMPDTDLEVISRKTGIAVDKLKKLNGFKTNVVEPYRPIRIR